MDYINIGIIQKPHGVKGELKIFPRTDFIKERFKVGNKVMLVLNGKKTDRIIATMRMHKGSVLVRFEGVESLNDVEHFHKGELFVPKDSLHSLPENQYYFVDLVGCAVYSAGQLLGDVTEVMENPAHPIMRIKTADRDVLVPFVDRFLEQVDTEKKRIDIRWMEGL